MGSVDMRNKQVIVGLCGLLIVSLSAQVQAAQFYRWVDEDGETHYGSEVPPQYLQQQHKSINEHGVTTKVYERTKTPEEAAREAAERRRRAQMRAVEQRRIDEQRREDQILLQTYSSLDDMELARDGKVAAIESVIRITKTNIAGMRSELTRMTGEAAERERSGQVVPPRLAKQIAASQTQISENLAFINKQRQEQDRVRALFAQDMVRYRRLREVQDTKQEKDRVFVARSQAAAMVGPIADNATIKCDNPVACAKAWVLAKHYVEKRAGPAVQMATDTLIMTYEPRRDSDIGMYVARYPEAGGGERIVAEVVCFESPGGSETCNSDRAMQIRTGFKTYIESGL